MALNRDPQLSRALLLALLLHLLLVLLVGNTPGGSAKPGEGVWGSLSVRLRSGEASDPRPGPPRAAPLDQPSAAQGPEGKSRAERVGGQVRREAEAKALPPTPGSAREGIWNANQGEVLEGETSAPQTQQTEPSPRAAAEPPLAPRLDLAPAVLPAGPAVNALSADLPRPDTALPNLPQAPSLPEPVQRRLDASALTRPAAVTAQPLLESRPALAAAAQGPLPNAPRAPRLPQLSQPPLAREALPASVNALPSLSQEGVPSLPEPRLKELAATSPLSRRSEAQAVAAPAAPIAPLESSAAARAEALGPAPEAPALPEQRIQQLRPESVAAPIRPSEQPQLTGVQALDPGLARGLSPAPAAPALLPAVPAPPVIGAPDAGVRLGQDVATPPSAAASAPRPKLNLSLPRGGETSGRDTRGLLQLMPQPPERKSRMQQGIEEATRKDCREAHADKGLLAAVPLVLGAGSDKGCRW